MDIRQLRFLAALARERHFARAAEVSGITQPTLSSRIKQLEDELGVTIVDRGQRFKGFTLEGERVLSWAQRILADCDAMVQELSEMKGHLQGRLEIGVIPSALIASADLSRRLRDTYPGITIRVLTMSSRQILQSLEQFDIHMGVTYLDNERLGPLQSKPLYNEHYALASRQELGEGDITWAEAATFPLCLMTPDMQHRRIIDRAFDKAGVIARPVVETNSVSALIAHVQAAGTAAILTDRQLAQSGMSEQLKSRKLIEPTIEHEIGLVALAKSPLPAIANALWRLF